MSGCFWNASIAGIYTMATWFLVHIFMWLSSDSTSFAFFDTLVFLDFLALGLSSRFSHHCLSCLYITRQPSDPWSLSLRLFSVAFLHDEFTACGSSQSVNHQDGFPLLRYSIFFLLYQLMSEGTLLTHQEEFPFSYCISCTISQLFLMDPKCSSSVPLFCDGLSSRCCWSSL